MFHVIKHIEIEDLGHFAPVLEERGIEYRRYRPYAGETLPARVEPGEGLIVLGGPMSVHDRHAHPWLVEETALIEQAVRGGRPVLGICLGSQLIALSLGARVYPAQVKEIGCSAVSLTSEAERDPVFAGFDHDFLVLQWHGDTFDIPKTAQRLARGIAVPNQAFRAGDRAYALQFHLEATDDMLRDWIEAYPDDTAYATVPGAEHLIATFSAGAPILKRQARSFFNAFLDRADPRPATR